MRNKNITRVERNKKPRILVFFLELIYIGIFLAITTPLILWYGPYENTRKVIISTILGTRHAYLITDYISQDTLNRILGVNNQAQEEPKEQVAFEETADLNKINVLVLKSLTAWSC